MVTEPKETEAKQTEPKGAEPKGGEAAKATGKPLGGPGEERTPLDLLREHQSTMLVALAVVIALSLAVIYQLKTRRDFDVRAWTRLGELKALPPADLTGFAEGTAEFAGSGAEPFFRIAWASRLYEKGTRGDAEEAVRVLKELEARFPAHPIVAAHVGEQRARIEAELADPRAGLVDVGKPSGS